MSQNPPPMPPTNPPLVYPAYDHPTPPPGGGAGRVFLTLFLVGSLVLNMILCAGFLFGGSSGFGDTSAAAMTERFVAGNSGAGEKIAVVRLEGAIMEGMLGYVHKQIDQAARDSSVKAVVLRVDSPGGSITASDDLLRRLEHLRDGTTPKYVGKSASKPLVVSMGSVAASGGYYVAMAAKQAKGGQPVKLFAERSTITGSIGVYASLPNAKGLADKIGFKMEMIKAGDIKGAGSMFHELTPAERQPWQDMVEAAYQQFIGVVENGRPELTGKMEQPLFAPRPVGKFDDKGNRLPEKGGDYTRRRADGGIFTAKEALQYGLIDAVGTVDDALAEAAKQAGVGDWRAIRYEKPVTLFSSLTGEVRAPSDPLGRLDLTPRLWFLLPHAEAAARINP